ncbi:fumarylacetoacetate hydrolase family protein [Rouxiella sp. WC2420]|uniref:Fumarylacetoacetate hydrolase family protein n=1 Tax=Rouxiella sp. WC2420 TaxID=3234145 RepID=A0AB39VVP0_9GAMM
MKFATLKHNNETSFVALIDNSGERYWPLAEIISGFMGDMSQLVQDWERVKHDINPTSQGYSLEEVSVEVPLQAKRNVFCVGKNYHEHAAEFSKSGFDHSAKEGEIAPEFAVVFSKTPETLIANHAVIPRHSNVTSQLDYEAELAVIIGKGGKGITKAEALKHVWGYTVINDVTARDLQKNHRQWFIGKSLDGFGPIGPWISTADEVDLSSSKIQCWVNGELRQNSNLGDLVFDVPTLIETLSAGIELKPGDIIATGTPAGVGIGFTPPKFLQTGDVVRIEIEGIGALENEVGE